MKEERPIRFLVFGEKVKPTEDLDAQEDDQEKTTDSMKQPCKHRASYSEKKQGRLMPQERPLCQDKNAEGVKKGTPHGADKVRTFSWPGAESEESSLRETPHDF
jgi:hypothetical protein